MILKSGSHNAASFTDETSPDTRTTRRRNVSIHATVIPDKRHDWYYEFLRLFPNIHEELKSSQALKSYKDLPRDKRHLIWNTLKEVHIHVSDPLDIQAGFERAAEKATGRPDAMALLRQRAYEGDEVSKQLLGFVNDSTAKLVIRSGLSRTVKRFVRHYEPYWSLRRFVKHDEFDWDDSDIDLSSLKSSNPGSVVRNAVTYTSKSAAAFSDAMDAFLEPDTYHSAYVMRRKMNRALQASHAFDMGNERAIEWIEDERENVAREIMLRSDYGYDYYGDFGREIPLSPLQSINSGESFFIQAADIAAGLARYLYEINGILGITIHFDYVTFNGRRVSRDDATEIMREWRHEGYVT